MFERSRKIAMNTSTPSTFEQLRLDGCIEVAHILKTADGFFLANRDLATILALKGIGGVLLWIGILSAAFVAVGYLFFGLDRLGRKKA